MKKRFLYASIMILATYQSSGCASAMVKWTPDTFSHVLTQYTQTTNMAGLIDQTFGTNGIVTTDVTPTHNSQIKSCVLQSDGKLVTAGYGTDGNTVFALARYNSNGSLDTTFGANGIVTTDVTPGHDSQINSCVLQSDGKIVTAGNGTNPGGKNFFALARYSSNGSLDTTFGTNGIITTDLNPGNNSVINSCVLQSDDKIVAAGYVNNAGYNVFAVARYNTDGSLDTTFGTNGIITTDLNPGNNSLINSCVLQSDDKIVAAGYLRYNGNDTFAFTRYNSDGSLDTTFGNQGIVISEVTSGSSQINSCTLQSDGKLVAAGYINNAGYSVFAVARYNSNGSIDTTFGTNGIVITDVSPGNDSIIFSCVLQPDGKIVAAGYGTNGNPVFALARYNTNGSLDTTFGNQGIVVTTNVALGFLSAITSCALQPDEKIIAAGVEYIGYLKFAIVRYINPFTLGSFTDSYGGVGIL